MALEMNLELEGSPPDWESVRQAALLSGVVDLELDKNGLSFCFDNSGTYAGSTRHHGWKDEIGNRHKGPRPFVTAEGNHGCKFLVDGLVFRINNAKYDETVEDIKNFLTHLSAISPMQFVLSRFNSKGCMQSEIMSAVSSGSGITPDNWRTSRACWISQ